MGSPINNQSTPDLEEIVELESSPDSDIEILKPYGLESSSFATREQKSREPREGMVFMNEIEAFNFYVQYAWETGFGVRKGSYRRLVDGTQRKRTFFCTKEGYRKKPVTSKVPKVNILETRTGCNAMIIFKIEKGEWIIDKFVAEYNQELTHQLNMLRSHRHVSEVQGDIINTMDNAGIEASSIYSYFVEETWDAENVGFQKSDCSNFLRSKWMEILQASNAQAVLDYFKKMQAEDPPFFYSIQADSENRLTIFFWRDSRSKNDYLYFCDVVVFDTTYRTNKYNMIFSLFIGVNHHGQNILFGCAFLLDETTESFDWFFRSFLEAMDGQEPVTSFTDQCGAMANSIGNVFSKTQHRLCLWHIGQNAAKHLSLYYRKSGFKSLFNRCLYDCETEDEFDAAWSSMVHDYGLVQNRWLDGLHKLREKWC